MQESTPGVGGSGKSKNEEDHSYPKLFSPEVIFIPSSVLCWEQLVIQRTGMQRGLTVWCLAGQPFPDTTLQYERESIGVPLRSSG